MIFRAYIRVVARVWVLAIFWAAVSLRVRTVAPCTVRLGFIWVGVGESLGDRGLELLTDLLVVLQQLASEPLGPLAGGSEDEAGDGLSSLAMVRNPRRPASKGMEPPPAVTSSTVAAVVVLSGRGSGLCRKARLLGNETSDQPPSALIASIWFRALTTSGDVPRLETNMSLSVFTGSMDAATTAREAINGRRAHQTCSWLTGGWPASAPPSRMASTLISLMGSHCSMSLVSVRSLRTCSLSASQGVCWVVCCSPATMAWRSGMIAGSVWLAACHRAVRFIGSNS